MLYIEGAAPFSLFILAALLHEMGHVIAVKHYGGNVKRIDVMPLGARIVTTGELSHIQDTVIYLSGAAANGFAALLFAPALMFNTSPYLLYFILSNIFLGAINLLPIKGNDGYCALSSFLENRNKYDKDTGALKRVMRVSDVLFFIFSFGAVYASGFNAGIISLVAAANIYKKY